MSAKVIQRIVEFFILLVVVGVAISLLRDLAALVSGEFGTVRWRVSAADVGQTINLSEQASIAMTHGNLAVANQPLAWTIEALSSLGQAVLFLLALLATRRLLIRFTQGDLFNQANAAELRKIGLLLLVVCGVSVVSTLAIQPMILSAVSTPSDMVLHPSISWDVKDMKNVWMDYSVPVAMFALGGIALLFAEAFKAGLAYREDSESVV